MTREETYYELMKGHKVRHEYFSDEEYLVGDGAKIMTEDGIDFTLQFWTGKFFAIGWSIIEN